MLTDYLTHIGISFGFAILYFCIQYDFNKKFEKQKNLLYLSFMVFVFIFLVCFCVVKTPKSVSFGENDIQEFEDEEGEEYDEGDDMEEEIQSIPSIPTQSFTTPNPPPSLNVPPPTANFPPLPTS
jgi:hypothetical protein